MQTIFTISQKTVVYLTFTDKIIENDMETDIMCFLDPELNR